MSIAFESKQVRELQFLMALSLRLIGFYCVLKTPEKRLQSEIANLLKGV
jgi:hypothetical protein